MPNPQDNRSERDLLIRLETKFESMNDSVKKLDKKLEDFNSKLEDVVKDIRDELKQEYSTKQELKVISDAISQLKTDVSTKYTPLGRFEPVEETHKDVAKRVRTLLVSVGVCILIAAASAPTWMAIYKTTTTPVSQQVGAK